jgi:hypothetical protein
VKFFELDLFGVCVAPISVMMVAAWVVTVSLRRPTSRFGLLREVSSWPLSTLTRCRVRVHRKAAPTAPGLVAGVLVVASVLGVLPGPAMAQDSGLEAARGRFPPLIMGPGVQRADGAGPFARPCPPAGSRVEQRGGPTIQYDGADPTNPNLCRMRFNGQQATGWFGIWLTSWPGAEDASTAMGRIIRGRTGDTEAFVVRMSPERRYYDILRNEGIENLHLLGRVYRTLKISHYREGVPPNICRSVVTGWKDINSGMIIYRTYQHIAGAPEIATPLGPTAIVSGP